MNGYLSIGKVSKLKNVSIKSLRYYDEIGILKPAYINAQTNYRYYTEDQLFVLDAIGLCLQLGIPLKSMHRYAKDGHLNLQKLLYDGKVLAEQKIGGIRSCLEKLQNTLNQMDIHAGSYGAVSTRAKAPLGTEDAGKALPELPVIQIPERVLLLMPLDEYATPKYYGQYILKLFVTAQQLRLTAAYPSGILHENKNGTVQKYMCLSVTAVEGRPADAGACRAWNSVHKKDALLRYFPACSTPQVLLKGLLKEDAASLLPQLSSCTGYTLLENDILAEDLKQQGYSRELLLLTTDRPDTCFA